jgi:hypothetical protein
LEGIVHGHYHPKGYVMEILNGEVRKVSKNVHRNDFADG